MNYSIYVYTYTHNNCHRDRHKVHAIKECLMAKRLVGTQGVCSYAVHTIQFFKIVNCSYKSLLIL